MRRISGKRSSWDSAGSSSRSSGSERGLSRDKARSRRRSRSFSRSLSRDGALKDNRHPRIARKQRHRSRSGSNDSSRAQLHRRKTMQGVFDTDDMKSVPSRRSRSPGVKDKFTDRRLTGPPDLESLKLVKKLDIRSQSPTSRKVAKRKSPSRSPVKHKVFDMLRSHSPIDQLNNAKNREMQSPSLKRKKIESPSWSPKFKLKEEDSGSKWSLNKSLSPETNPGPPEDDESSDAVKNAIAKLMAKHAGSFLEQTEIASLDLKKKEGIDKESTVKIVPEVSKDLKSEVKTKKKEKKKDKSSKKSKGTYLVLNISLYL